MFVRFKAFLIRLVRFLKITNMFSVNRDSNDNEVSPVDFSRNKEMVWLRRKERIFFESVYRKRNKSCWEGLIRIYWKWPVFERYNWTPASIFSRKVETVGNLMQERKTVDWSKAKINISKETMEVVEMECKMNPEYSEKYSKLDWRMILYHRWDCWIPWTIFGYLFLLRIMSEVSSKKRNHQSKTERILDVFQWIGMIM